MDRRQDSLSSSASKRTREGWQFQSLSEGASRAGLDLSLSLAGLEYQPAHQRTHNISNWKTGCSEVGSLGAAAVPQHGPSLPVPHPPCPHPLGAEASVSRNAGYMYRSSGHRRAKRRLCFWAPMLCRRGLDQRQDTKATPGTPLRGGQRKREGIQPPHHGTPVEHGLANSCWQAGRSGRDGVMLQGAPVSRDLVGLSDRAGSDAATSDHQTEPTSTLHPDEPESTPPHAYYPFDRVGISKHMGAGPRCLLACCVSGWLQDSVGIHKHISRSSSALTTWLRADRGGFQAPTPPVRQMKAI